jgi:hypothetical protein
MATYTKPAWKVKQEEEMYELRKYLWKRYKKLMNYEIKKN